MTPEFSILVNPVFREVLDYERQIRASGGTDLQDAWVNIRKSLDYAMERAKTLPHLTDNDVELARRGLIYWIDELMVNADRRWGNMTLEFAAYNEIDGAVRFYEYCEREVRHTHPDIIEIWFLALTLGFAGDILVAYHDHLGRNPPGSADDQVVARTTLAKDLFRSVRHTHSPPDLPKVELSRFNATLKGNILLKTSLQFLCMIGVVGLGILAWWQFG